MKHWFLNLFFFKSLPITHRQTYFHHSHGSLGIGICDRGQGWGLGTTHGLTWFQVTELKQHLDVGKSNTGGRSQPKEYESL